MPSAALVVSGAMTQYSQRAKGVQNPFENARAKTLWICAN